MRRFLVVGLVTVLCTLGLVAPAAADASSAARGEFEVTLDFATLTLAPVGANCLLKVDTTLAFAGTLQGTADGVTAALVRAPCSEVPSNPPGTFSDVFSSRLAFSGTADGAPVVATIVYRGVTAPGGDVRGVMTLSDGLRGALLVVARLGAGGSYTGRLHHES